MSSSKSIGLGLGSSFVGLDIMLIIMGGDLTLKGPGIITITPKFGVIFLLETQDFCVTLAYLGTFS